ncbi:PRD domain-containing protein [Metabacillus arenae]|uniref:PRD domain-containing protein n=1 Tax=Metabacillus arenae TaxID=2771434 RepID=A0A926NKV9_9BACI|nr:PRD domain-containing protein [Metabacillus arenae]MBD1382915.1 PRD domain-containing protein [Metabacillus arenae]
MNQLQEKLEILKSSDCITENAHFICQKTMEEFYAEADARGYSTLITHLAMAVTRIERKKPLDRPPAVIMKEIYNSPNLEEARRRVIWIESQLNQPIPMEEKEFLFMHFVAVLTTCNDKRRKEK